MKKDGFLHAFAGQTDLMKRKSEELASNLEKNTKILNELMNSDVSYLNLNKVSFQRKKLCFGYKEENLKCFGLVAYVEKGAISLDKEKRKITIPEANYYEGDKLLEGSNRISRRYNLINDFPFHLYWVLQGKHEQTEDWHLFYRIGGFCGPMGIDATSEHASVYVLSGYEKFQKLEKICKEIMKKEKISNPGKHKPDILQISPKMPWPIVKELHHFAGLIGPLPIPEIEKMRKLMGISEIDESYAI